MSRDKDQSFEDLRREAEQLEVTPSPAAWNRLERKLDRRRDSGGLLVPLRPWLRAAVVLLVLVVAAIVLWPDEVKREAAFAPQTVSVEFVAAEPNPGELRRIAEVRSAYRQSLAWVASADASGGELLALNVAPSKADDGRSTGIPPGNKPGNSQPEALAQAGKIRQTPALEEEVGSLEEPAMDLITEDNFTDLPETSLTSLSIFRWMEGNWRKLEQEEKERMECTFEKNALTGRKSGEASNFELALRATTGGTPALILHAGTPAEKRYNFMGREGDRYFFKSQRPRGTGEELLIEWRPGKEEMIWVFGAQGGGEMGNVPFADLTPPVDTARVEKWGKE